jgi:hypothetical protein
MSENKSHVRSALRDKEPITAFSRVMFTSEPGFKEHNDTIYRLQLAADPRFFENWEKRNAGR